MSKFQSAIVRKSSLHLIDNETAAKAFQSAIVRKSSLLYFYIWLRADEVSIRHRAEVFFALSGKTWFGGIMFQSAIVRKSSLHLPSGTL